MGSRTLSTTSYAVLGLLATGDWSTYELSRQARRSLGNFWPRAESNLYEAAKSLVEHGLAEARSEHVGRRPRTVYSITDAGRRALGRWVAERGRPPVVSFETLIKVFFAEHAGRTELLDHLDRTRADAEQTLARLSARAGPYAEGDVPLPDRLPQITLAFRFLWEQAQTVRRWAKESAREVEQWPDDPAEWARHQSAAGAPSGSRSGGGPGRAPGDPDHR